MLRNPPNHNAGNPLRILNEVLSLNAQEYQELSRILESLAVLNEVLSLNAQEYAAIPMAIPAITILNEVLSLNAQESVVENENECEEHPQ